MKVLVACEFSGVVRDAFVPWMEKWTAHCLKCMWFPKGDYERFISARA